MPCQDRLVHIYCTNISTFLFQKGNKCQDTQFITTLNLGWDWKIAFPNIKYQITNIYTYKIRCLFSLLKIIWQNRNYKMLNHIRTRYRYMNTFVLWTLTKLRNGLFWKHFSLNRIQFIMIYIPVLFHHLNILGLYPKMTVIVFWRAIRNILSFCILCMNVCMHVCRWHKKKVKKEIKLLDIF